MLMCYSFHCMHWNGWKKTKQNGGREGKRIGNSLYEVWKTTNSPSRASFPNIVFVVLLCFCHFFEIRIRFIDLTTKEKWKITRNKYLEAFAIEFHTRNASNFQDFPFIFRALVTFCRLKLFIFSHLGSLVTYTHTHTHTFHAFLCFHWMEKAF